MTKLDESAPARRPGRRGLVAALAFAAVASFAVLYGLRGAGKEPASTECADAARAAARIAPLAQGEVAALAVNHSPKPIGDLAFLSADGKPTRLSALHGKTILLNLWATWCIPCRQEMPALDRLQDALGSQKFEVVAIDIDTTRLDRRKPFLDEVGVKSLAFYADPSAEVFQRLKKAGKVLGLPTTFLVDGNGCELGAMAGPADWASTDAIKLASAAIAP